jgi:hypothetical protein
MHASFMLSKIILELLHSYLLHDISSWEESLSSPNPLQIAKKKKKGES